MRGVILFLVFLFFTSLSVKALPAEETKGPQNSEAQCSSNLFLEQQKKIAKEYLNNHETEKAIQILEEQLDNNPYDEELLKLIIKNYMAQENWDKALCYTSRALEKNPNSEELLSIQGKLYSSMKDYSNALKTYQKLISICSKECYKLDLDDSYQVNKTFYGIETPMPTICKSCPVDKGVLNTCLNLLLAQEKTQEAYSLMKEYGLENTPEGLRTQAEIEMLKNNYEAAECLYRKALQMDKDNECIKNEFAICLRKERKFREAQKLCCEILKKNPNFIDAKIGLTSIEMDKGNYNIARKMFQAILCENPDCEDAKIGIIYSYMADNQNLEALKLLNKMPNSDEVNYAKAGIYYKLDMYSDAKQALKGVVQKDTKELDNQIRRERAFTVTPSYTFFNQELNEQYDLDLRKAGITVSEYGANNTKAFIDYGLYLYISGRHKDDHLTDTTNEIRGGIQARPNEKFEYRTDIGLKVFQSADAMINTDSWLKYYVSDFLNYRVGFERNNVEQSYLSAVGFPINGVFTGQVARNRAYTEIEGRLPNKYYYYGKAGGGVYTAQNLPTNAFVDGTLGLGKTIYNNPKNKWIQTITADIMTYNASYQTNLLNIRAPAGATDSGTFGGYFSPSYYNADTINVKLEGGVKKWHLKYGIKGFVGAQFVFTPDNVSPVYGIYPYINYDLNDHISVNLSYSFSDYFGIQRHLAIISVDIRGFRKRK